jgi:hypothetical protein
MQATIPAFPASSGAFVQLVRERIFRQCIEGYAFKANGDLRHVSAVLFLLGTGLSGEPVLILNKRSRHVRQPGDLCCPGGGVSPSVDRLLSKGLQLPATPLSRWPQAHWWRRNRQSDWPKLALLLATALREGFEEMRINPFTLAFLGPLPSQHLIMFKRAIYPLVGWVGRQRQFSTNWEVEKIVRIPLAALLDVDNYARYRLSFRTGKTDGSHMCDRDMPCFVHRQDGKHELLWGATYRITEQFLSSVFGFDPPPMMSLPIIHRQLDRHYLEGHARDRADGPMGRSRG